MTIPDFQTLMLPVLTLLSDGAPRSQQEITSLMADQFALTDAERKQLLPSGRQATIANRVGWVRTYLKKAGLVSAPSRGVTQISAAGTQVLAAKPTRIDISFLEQFPEFTAFREKSSTAEAAGTETPLERDAGTPQEAFEASYMVLRKELASQLLEHIMRCSPQFFEQLVVDLLVAMGYGGSLEDAGKSIGRSGDDGIDGIIKEDKLGLDVVYIQAKRWQGSVGRPVVQSFAGSLEGQRARKGVLITTSTFSPDAREYVTRIEKKIVLIDGALLAELMIDHDVGVSAQKTFTLKRLDLDYFDIE